MAVCLLLGGFLGPGGGELGVGLPSAIDLLAAEASPGGVAFRVEADDGAIVGAGLVGKAVLIAPFGEVPLVVGGIGGDGASALIRGEGGGEAGVGLDAGGDLAGPAPLAVEVANQAHQAAGGGVLGIGEHGQGEVLEPLGAEAVLLAPEGQSHVGVGIATGLGAGGAVGGEIGGGGCVLGGGRQGESQAGTGDHQARAEHRRGPFAEFASCVVRDGSRGEGPSFAQAFDQKPLNFTILQCKRGASPPKALGRS